MLKKDHSIYLKLGEGGNGAQVIVEYNTILPPARQGFGTVHHAAFRVEDRSVLEEWTTRMESFGFQTSGYVNRHFFRVIIRKSCTMEFYLSLQQMVQDLWEMNLMKHLEKNYLYLHS